MWASVVCTSPSVGANISSNFSKPSCPLRGGCTYKGQSTVNTKAQTTIYVVSFLACVTIAYLVGNERGPTQGHIAGEATANKAWVTKDAHKDTMHALAVS